MARIRIGTLMGGMFGFAGLAIGLYMGMGDELSQGEPLAVGVSLGFLSAIVGILCWGNRASRPTVGS